MTFSFLVSRQGCSSSHLAATFCAGTAGGHAGVHVAETLAIVGAFGTDLRAQGAKAMMMTAADEHHRARRAAQLGAGLHQPNVFRLDMPATHVQAMLHQSLRTGGIACEAMIGASPRRALMPQMLVMHKSLLSKYASHRENHCRAVLFRGGRLGDDCGEIA
jgi:hypothetical protein